MAFENELLPRFKSAALMPDVAVFAVDSRTTAVDTQDGEGDDHTSSWSRVRFVVEAAGGKWCKDAKMATYFRK